MENEKAKFLISELLKDPFKFAKQGMSDILLQEYFHGFEIETLRPLLKSKNIYIQSAATYIVSELGRKANPLIDDIIPLLKSENLAIKYEALESIMIGSIEQPSKFIYIIEALDDADESIRLRAMELIMNSHPEQIKESIKYFEQKPDIQSKNHLICLDLYLQFSDVDPKRVTALIIDNNPLIRKYGAIIAKKVFEKFPYLTREASQSLDLDIYRFINEA